MKILLSFLLFLAFCSSLAMGFKCCDYYGKVLFEDATHSCEGHRMYARHHCDDFWYFG